MFQMQMVESFNKKNTVLVLISYFLVYFIMIGGVSLLPFQNRGGIEETLETLGASDAGNSTRQIFYVLVFALTTYFSVNVYKSNWIKVISLPMICFFSYCLLSSMWAINPGVSIRRAIVGIFFVVIVFNLCAVLGPAFFMRMLERMMVFLIVGSLIAVVIYPAGAKHSASEIDPALIGAWRGLFGHKNGASSICVVAMVLFTVRAAFTRKIYYFGLIFLTLVFLLGTKGKASLGYAFPTLIFVLMYIFYAKRGRSVSFLLGTTVAVLIAVPLAALVLQDKIAEIFADPTALTGRIAIWDFVGGYVREHPLTGAGYGSFWQAGENSPIIVFNPGDWLAGVLHSHNGYLEIAAMIGIPGLILCIFAAIIIPMRNIALVGNDYPQFSAVMIGFMVYGVLVNFTETQLYSKDWEVWLMMTIANATSFHLLSLKNSPQSFSNSPRAANLSLSAPISGSV